MGVGYLKKLVNDYPDSPFAKEAQVELSALDAAPKQP
jgi:outer membrane protein assembly factor BamD (BamD/ComL family)